MEVFLKDKCKCGGKIVIVSYKETDSNSKLYGQTIVSHGVCSNCLQNVVLPTELYSEFVRENCFKSSI